VTESSFDREAAAAYLTSALTRDRFLLYCQPIVLVETPQADQHFFEVLVRFRDEEEGLLPPGSFIPVLRDAGLMPLLDRWVVSTAIRKLRSVAQSGAVAPRFSINLSAEALVDKTFPAFVAAEFGGATDLAQRVMLEIPLDETAQRPAEFGAAVAALTALGCVVAVSGVSHDGEEIGRLYEVGVRYLKVNGASALRADPNPDALERLRSLGDSCRALGMKMIAESVERVEALGLLSLLKIDFAQGFALGEPKPL
jgi:EAL domain-containing protein (putative c-di-GMP-specific phosphodiesterase class I)